MLQDQDETSTLYNFFTARDRAPDPGSTLRHTEIQFDGEFHLGADISRSQQRCCHDVQKTHSVVQARTIRTSKHPPHHHHHPPSLQVKIIPRQTSRSRLSESFHTEEFPSNALAFKISGAENKPHHLLSSLLDRLVSASSRISARQVQPLSKSKLFQPPPQAMLGFSATEKL